MPKREVLFLEKAVKKSPLVNGQHDIEGASFPFSNGYLGYINHSCRETARNIKEAIQARGIIFIDGKAWTEDRGRPQSEQVITFTPAFIAWLKKSVAEKKIQDAREFGYCDGYVKKMVEKRARSFLAKAAFFSRQVLISVVENFSEVAKELVPPPTNSFGTFNKIAIQNNEDMNYKPSIRKQLTNSLLASLIQTTDPVKHKPITSSTIEFCKGLLKSGMTKVEVARQMISQGYIRTMEDFDKKLFPQMIC